MTFLDQITEQGTLICDTDGDGLTINPSEGVPKARREELQREARRRASKGLELCRKLMEHTREKIPESYETVLRSSGWTPPPDNMLDEVIVWESTSKRGTGKAGMYTFKTKTIDLTMAFLTTEERYFQTLCHEWAHAVCHIGFPDGTKVGHSERWRAVMVEMGCKPDRCHEYSKAEAFPNRYVEVVCPRCKTNFGSVTKNKALTDHRVYSCRACKQTGISLKSAYAAAAGAEFVEERPALLNLGLDLRAELMEWNDGADDIYRLAKYEKREHLSGAIGGLKKLLRSDAMKQPYNKRDAAEVKALIKKLENFL